jgi:hypothetical protein
MPLIQVKLIEEVFTPAQKREIITKLRTRWSPSREKTCGPTHW